MVGDLFEAEIDVDGGLLAIALLLMAVFIAFVLLVLFAPIFTPESLSFQVDID